MKKILGELVCLLFVLLLANSTFAANVPVPNGDFESPYYLPYSQAPSNWYVNNPLKCSLRDAAAWGYGTGQAVMINTQGGFVLTSQNGITQVHTGDTITFQYLLTLYTTPNGYSHDIYLLADDNPTKYLFERAAGKERQRI